MSAEFIQFIPRPRHKRISRRLLFALGRMIPPWPTPMLPQASLPNRRGGKPSVAKTLVENSLSRTQPYPNRNPRSRWRHEMQLRNSRSPRVCRQRRSRSRLGQGHATAGEQRRRCAPTDSTDRALSSILPSEVSRMSRGSSAVTGEQAADVRAIVVETLTEQQRIRHDDIDAVVFKAVTTTLTSFGIDEEDRKEVRADFQHVRRWRRRIEQAQSYIFNVVLTVTVTGFVGAVWLGIKATLGK